MKLHIPFSRANRPKIFISYRRDDTEVSTDVLYERFVSHFGRKQIFVDVDNIPIGKDFVEVINAAVNECDILLVVIGKQWLSISDGQQRRLDNPEDFVRLEIATALRSGVPVSPVLVQGATMPRSQELPEELKSLARRNAFQISRTHRREDIERLIKEVERVLAQAPKTFSGTMIEGRILARIVFGIVSLALLVLSLAYAWSSRNVATYSVGTPSPSPTEAISPLQPDASPDAKSTPINSPSFRHTQSPTPAPPKPTPREIATPSPLRNDNTQGSVPKTVSTPILDPSKTITLDIDPTTGLIAVEFCPVIRTKTFILGTEPKKYCGPEKHQR